MDWATRVSNHPTLQLLSTLRSRLDGLDSSKDAAAVATLDRLKAVVGYLTQAIDTSPPHLLTVSMLDVLSGPLSSLSSEVEAFADAGDAEALTRADSYADAALDQARGWPQIHGKQDLERLVKDAESHRADVHRALSEVVQDAEEAKKAVSTLKGLTTKARQNLDQDVKEVREEVKTVAADIDQEKLRLQTVATQFNEQFAESQKAHRAEFEQLKTQLQQESEGLREKHQEILEGVGENLKTEANDTLQELQSLKKQATKLVGVIGSTGMTGGFKKYADEQQQSANRWRLIALGSLFAVVVVGLWILFSSRQSFDLERVVLKAFVTVPLGVAATYAARQSGRHRKNEEAARRFELEVAALDPYIALLPVERRYDLKEEMARKLFGHSISGWRTGESKQEDELVVRIPEVAKDRVAAS